jgi:hypothetical protein
MGAASPTPRELVARACLTYGHDVVITRCAALARGEVAEPIFLSDLVGRPAQTVLSGREGSLDGYWPRVWGLRAFLYAYNASVDAAIRAGTRDDSWRVREMAAKVTRQHAIHDLLDDMIRLRSDDVPRVRAAAERALRALAE